MFNDLAILESVNVKDGDRKGLEIVQATETIWTMTSPEVYNLLTKDRGWSKEKYIAWLGHFLTKLLLP
jgi:hypothetical protein